MILHAGLAQTLRDALGPKVRVLDHPSALGGLKGPTVAVWTTSLVPAQHAPAGGFVADYTVELLTPHQDPRHAEPALAALLTDVLAALWARGDYLLTRADRATNEDRTLHAWTLTVTGAFTITPEE